MSGKGAKGLITFAKTSTAKKDKDKKKPTSCSSRAGLQDLSLRSPFSFTYFPFTMPLQNPYTHNVFFFVFCLRVILVLVKWFWF